MKSYVLPVAVVLVHVVAVGGFLLVQGCGTTAPGPVDRAPAPVLPAGRDPAQVRTPQPVQPRVRPPVIERETPPPREVKTYEVREGDMLSRIAQRHGVTTRELVEINKLSDPNTLRVGMQLVLPPHATVPTEPAQPRVEPRTPATPAQPGAVYEVQQGDHLSGIAVQHGTTTAELMRLNNLTDANLIRVGQKLRIPGGSAEAPPTTTRTPADPPRTPADPPNAPEAEPRTDPVGDQEEAPPRDPPPRVETPRVDGPAPQLYPYTVREGESLMDIAKAFVVSPQKIMELNQITDPDSLKPGQQILIPPADL
jgi:LysM repeat protein